MTRTESPNKNFAVNAAVAFNQCQWKENVWSNFCNSLRHTRDREKLEITWKIKNVEKRKIWRQERAWN